MRIICPSVLFGSVAWALYVDIVICDVLLVFTHPDLRPTTRRLCSGLRKETPRRRSSTARQLTYRKAISPVDIPIKVLDPDDVSYDRYRGNLNRDSITKLMELLEKIMADHSGPLISNSNEADKVIERVF
jgi:hypothetical protein